MSSRRRPNRFLAEFVFFADRALRDPSNESVVIALFKELESTANAILGFSAAAQLQALVCRHGVLCLLRHMDYDWSTISDPLPSFEPLLWMAIFEFEGSAPQQLNVVSYLLENGANPNQKWNGLSHFQEYLELLFTAMHGTDTEELSRKVFRISAALVAHGADLSALVKPQPNERAIPARDAIRTLFPPQWASMILEGSPAGKVALEQLSRSNGKRRDGSSTEKRGQGQVQEQPSTSGSKTVAVSRRAAVRSWVGQHLGRKKG